eukprot:TRINITY_DN4018_c1_g1_i2.p1 TRINITY_DN4018_c1_g1~~TRINITY_DN4018_c1_g1_i2.p1  ORF type:complete len:266 (-),score=13.41 TRINITY_DN4018_c1_g1_i2:47-844(-)
MLSSQQLRFRTVQLSKQNHKKSVFFNTKRNHQILRTCHSHKARQILNGNFESLKSAKRTTSTNRRMSLNILATVTNICLQNPAVSASLFQDDPLYEKDTQMRINKLINPKIAAAFTESVYYGVRESGCGLTEEEFQKQLFKLRDREYKYYYEMKKDQLPRIPDLSDMSGGLSNPAYFNFVSYVAWKVVSGQIKDAKTRNQIVQLSGINLLNKIAPDVLDQVKSKNYSLGSPMPIILLQNLIEQILDKLTNSGSLSEAVQIGRAHV